MTPVAFCLEELLPVHPSSPSYATASLLIRTALVVSTVAVALLIPFFGARHSPTPTAWVTPCHLDPHAGWAGVQSPGCMTASTVQAPQPLPASQSHGICAAGLFLLRCSSRICYGAHWILPEHDCGMNLHLLHHINPQPLHVELQCTQRSQSSSSAPSSAMGHGCRVTASYRPAIGRPYACRGAIHLSPSWFLGASLFRLQSIILPCACYLRLLGNKATVAQVCSTPYSLE